MPPFEMPRIPVTSLTRSIREAVMAPRVECKIPVPRKENLADLETVSCEVLASVVTARLVVVALVAVALPVMFKLPEIVEEAAEMKPLFNNTVWVVVGVR